MGIKRNWRGWVGVGVVALGGAVALGDEPLSGELPGPVEALTIATERPGFSDTAGIAHLMHLTLETGYTFTHRDRDGAETDRHNGPEALARFGLMDDVLELRISWAGYVHSETDAGGPTTTANGWADPAFGIKVKLADQGQWCAWMPRLALVAMTTLGGGTNEVSSQRAEPTVKLIWSYDLGKCWGEKWAGWTVLGNANVTWTNSGGERFTQGQGSVMVCFPTLKDCTGFVEYYVLSPNAKGTDAAHYADVGGAWLVCPRFQVDARVGFGLNGEADNVFFGVGASVLF